MSHFCFLFNDPIFVSSFLFFYTFYIMVSFFNLFSSFYCDMLQTDIVPVILGHFLLYDLDVSKYGRETIKCQVKHNDKNENP